MKVDCGYTENYFKEKKRMTKNCQINCRDCQLGSDNNKTILFCKGLENICPDKAIEIVHKWRDEHPVETRMEHFLKVFPNARVDNGRPSVCVRYLNENIKCSLPKTHCKACWNKPYTEGEF